MTTELFLRLAFFLFALMAVGGGLLMVTLRNLLHMILAMAMSFIGVAGLYLLLESEFLFVVQVLVYVGAVVVLYMFAVMLTRYRTHGRRMGYSGNWGPALVVAAVTLFGVLLPLAQSSLWTGLERGPLPEGLVARLGRAFVTSHLLPFEVASIVLLVAMIGAILVAREPEGGE